MVAQVGPKPLHRSGDETKVGRLTSRLTIPSAPFGSVTVGANPSCAFWHDDMLFVTANKLLQALNPKTMAVIGTQALGDGLGTPLALTGREHTAWVVDYSQYKLWAVDITRPSNMVALGYADTLAGPHSAIHDGQYIWTSSTDTAYIQAFGISGRIPKLKSQIHKGTTSSVNVWPYNDYIYVAGSSSNAVQIIDARTFPWRFVKSFSVGLYSRWVTAEGGYLYSLTETDSTLKIWSLADPENPVLVGSPFITGDGPHDLLVHGEDVLIVACRLGNVIDVLGLNADKTVITRLGQFATAASPVNIGASGSTLAVPCYTASPGVVQFFDLKGLKADRAELGGAWIGDLKGRTAAVRTLDVVDGMNVGGSADLAGNTSINDLAVVNTFRHTGRASAVNGKPPRPPRAIPKAPIDQPTLLTHDAVIRQALIEFGILKPALYDAAYVSFPGTAGNYAATKDSVSLSITSSLALVADIAPAKYHPPTPQVLIAKFATGGRSYELYQDTNGTLVLVLSSDGGNTIGTAISSVALSYGDLVRKVVAAEWDQPASRVRFYVGDNEGSLAQLGTDRMLTMAAIFDSPSRVEIGSNDGGTFPFTGRVYRAKIKSGSLASGPVVADFNPALIEVYGDREPSSLTDVQGNVWGVNGSGWTWGRGPFSVSSFYLPAVVGNSISTPDTPANSPSSVLDARVWIAPNSWQPPSVQVLISKLGVGNTRAFQLYLNPDSTLTAVLSSDGANSFAVTSSEDVSLDDLIDRWVRLTWRQTDGRTRFLLSTDGEGWVPVGVDRTITLPSPGTIFNSTAPIEVGGNAGGEFPFGGYVKRALLLNAIDGVPVVDFNPALITSTDVRMPATAIGGLGEIWTPAGSLWDWAA